MRERILTLAGGLAEAYPYLDRQTKKWSLHPLVDELPPDTPEPTLEQVAIHWPHFSQDGRVAYTPDAKAGSTDKVRVCSPGSYLNRVLAGQLKGHEIETIVAKLNSTGSTFLIVSGDHIVETMKTIFQQGKEGSPFSCMTKDWDGDHPYKVFSERCGWSLAIRKEGTKIRARALVNDRSFVRIYGPCGPSDFSHPDDPLLRDWLEHNRFSSIGSWRGKRLEIIEIDDDEILAPYLDGGCQLVDKDGYICCDGEYEFSNTNGTSSNSHCGQVEIDGEWYDEDDDSICFSRYHSAWMLYDDAILSEIMDDHIRTDDAVEFIDSVGRDGYINTDWIADDHQAKTRYDIVELDEEFEGYTLCRENLTIRLFNGDLVFQQQEGIVEVNGEYFREDDDKICLDKDGEWRFQDDCVQDLDEEWILKADAVLLTAGKYKGNYIHRDDVVETSDGEFVTDEDSQPVPFLDMTVVPPLSKPTVLEVAS